MVSFQNLFFTFMFVGMAILSVFAFIIFVQEDNNVSEGFSENTLMNQTYVGIRSDLTSLRDSGQTQKDLFEEENPTSGFGTILLFSIVSFGKVFNAMIISLFNILIRLPVVVLGVDPAIASVFTTMLISSILIGLWILYKLGG